MGWEMNLKPGDKVIRRGWDNEPKNVLTVKKVTPTGIVRCNGWIGPTITSYKYCKYSDKVEVFGGYWGDGYITPYTEEGAEAAEKYQESEAKAEKDRKIIKAARQAVDSVYDKFNCGHLTVEQAQKILDFAREMGVIV